MMVTLFDRTISFLSKALDMMSARHELIATNIANQDTPNYKAKDITFKEALESVLNVSRPAGEYRTNPRHIPVGGTEGASGEGRIFHRPDSGTGYDNNSVNVEIEMAQMAKNTILYNAAAQIISTKLKNLSYAIREGR